MDNNNTYEITDYSTFFLFPFKIHTKLPDGLSGYWVEETLKLWDGVDDNNKENNQELLYFHQYIRQAMYNLKSDDESDKFLKYYRLTDERLKSLGINNNPKIIINGNETKFNLSDISLYIFKDNKIGILSIGVKSDGCSLKEAFEFNKLFRLLYISDTEQLADKRIYESIKIKDTQLQNIFTEQEHFTIYEDRIKRVPKGINSIVNTLLEPLKYLQLQDYTPLLDDKMVLHGFVCLKETLKEKYFDEPKQRFNEQGMAVFSRLLYVDDYKEYYYYNPRFIKPLLKKHTYTRWEHHGRLYGFCRYADMTMLFSDPEFLETNFKTVYYKMAILSLFYRCALIDFADRSSSVTKELIKQDDWTSNEKVKQLRQDFLKFANVWYFKEVTNQVQGIEMFEIQRQAYELDELFRGVKEEIEKLDEFIRIEQVGNEQKAINELTKTATPLLILSILTGFMGMNLDEGMFKVIREGKDFEWTLNLIIPDFIFIALLALSILFIFKSFKTYCRLTKKKNC